MCYPAFGAAFRRGVDQEQSALIQEIELPVAFFDIGNPAHNVKLVNMCSCGEQP